MHAGDLLTNLAQNSTLTLVKWLVSLHYETSTSRFGTILLAHALGIANVAFKTLDQDETTNVNEIRLEFSYALSALLT